MKKKRMLGLALLLIASLALGACAPAEEPVVEEEPAAEVEEAEEAEEAEAEETEAEASDVKVIGVASFQQGNDGTSRLLTAPKPKSPSWVGKLFTPTPKRTWMP